MIDISERLHDGSILAIDALEDYLDDHGLEPTFLFHDLEHDVFRVAALDGSKMIFAVCQILEKSEYTPEALAQRKYLDKMFRDIWPTASDVIIANVRADELIHVSIYLPNDPLPHIWIMTIGSDDDSYLFRSDAHDVLEIRFPFQTDQ